MSLPVGGRLVGRGPCTTFVFQRMRRMRLKTSSFAGIPDTACHSAEGVLTDWMFVDGKSRTVLRRRDVNTRLDKFYDRVRELVAEDAAQKRDDDAIRASGSTGSPTKAEKKRQRQQ